MSRNIRSIPDVPTGLVPEGDLQVHDFLQTIKENVNILIGELGDSDDHSPTLQELEEDKRVPTPTTQEEQEEVVPDTRYVAPSSQQYHPSACKGWVQFNGGGTIQDSYNVTSISINSGDGHFTVNWDIPFADTSYCVVGACGEGASNNNPSTLTLSGADITATSVRFQTTRTDTDVRTNNKYNCIAAFGRQAKL